MTWKTKLPLVSARKAKALVKQGNEARARQDWSRAATAFREALEHDPGMWPIWVQLGHAEKEEGDHEEAVKAYMEATRLAPKEADAFNHLAHLLERLERKEEAIVAWVDYLRLNPDDEAANDRLRSLSMDAARDLLRERQRESVRRHRQAHALGANGAFGKGGVVARLQAEDAAAQFSATGLPGGRVAAWLMVPDTLPKSPVAGLWQGDELVAIAPLEKPIEGRKVDLVFDLPEPLRHQSEAQLSVSLLSVSGSSPNSQQWIGLPPAAAANVGDTNFAMPPQIPLKEFGILVFGFTRTKALHAVLESLHRQGASALTEVWIDGHQENAKLRGPLLETRNMAAKYPLAALKANEGNFGFRKMMLLGLQHMATHYDKFVILEDDCFPTRDAVDVFYNEIERISGQDKIFSVYGHPFLVPSETDTCPRFQGWGWGTTSAKMTPLLNELTECFSMTEWEYLEFVDRALTAPIDERINVTPGRQPSDTLRRFFAWDETLCLLAARRGLVHKPTDKRVIYNFGMGADGTHFEQVERHRKPPFNMISLDEVWDFY